MVTRPRPRSTRLLLVVLVSLSLAIITIDSKQGEDGFLAATGRKAVQLMAPLQRAMTRVTEPIGNFFSGLAHLPSLERENEDLKARIASLEAQLQLQADVQALVAELEDKLNLKQSFAASTPSVAALVIANAPSNFEWTVTIDKGSDSGISVDDPVIVGSSVEDALLVGRVVSVTPDASQVQLIIDRKASVAAFLPGVRTRGIVEGQGDDDMTMRFVDTTAQVASGDVVETSGYQVGTLGGIYPPGLIVGTVSRTLPPENDVDAFILVRPAVDFSNLRIVLVLKTGERSA